MARAAAETLGRLLREEVKRQGQTVSSLASQLSMAPSTLYHQLQGYSSLTLVTAIEILIRIGVDPDEFFSRIDYGAQQLLQQDTGKKDL